MLKIKNAVKKYRSIPVATGVASVAMAFPAFAEGGTPATGLDSLLATFSVVTAWLWKECGLLLLLAAMCLFFAGAVVAFFMRIYHQV